VSILCRRAYLGRLRPRGNGGRRTTARRPLYLRLAALLGAALALAALLPPPGGDASLSGAWDKKAYGCVCHSSPANTSVLVDVQGFPARYDLGGMYPLEIRLVSTPINMTGQWKAGFNAEVSQGAFSVPAALDAVAQAYGNQASHRLNGTALTNWSITWLAPASPSGVVTLWVTVNTVNGNGVPDLEDKWAQVRLESIGPSPDTGGGGALGQLTSGGPVSWAAFGAAGFGLAGAAVFTIRRRKRKVEVEEPPAKRRRRRRKAPKETAKRPPRGRGRGR